MNAPRTYTHTWTQTRLETIQDQFRFLLMYANLPEATIDKVVAAVGQKVVGSVAIYACDATGFRVIEVELRVDWGQYAQLTLQVPEIQGGLPGWLDHQSPEVRVAGKRFAEVVKEQGFTNRWWLGLAPHIEQNATSRDEWKAYLGIQGETPPWKDKSSEERSESLLDLPEAQIFMRRWST